MGDIFSDEGLLDVFNSFFEMKATPKDIKELKSDFVMKVYTYFIKDFGAGIENIKQMPFDLLTDSMQQYPDMYRQVVPTMNLAKVIRYFIREISGDDSFVPADLFDPKPRRTRRFFSILAHFYFHASELIGNLEEIEEQTELKQAGKAKTQENVDQLMNRIEQLQRDNAENQLKEQKELRTLQELRDEVQEEQESKVRLKGHLEEVRLRGSNLTLEIRNTELEIIECRERVEKLSRQVIQATEKQDIDERERKLAKIKSENEQRFAQEHEHKANLARTKQALEVVLGHLHLVAEVKAEVEKKRQVLERLGGLEGARGGLVEEGYEADLMTQQKEQQVAARLEKLAQVKAAWKLKKASIHDEKNQHKRTLEEIRRSQTEDHIAAQDMEVERCRLEEETRTLAQQIAVFEGFIRDKYQMLLTAMESHKSELSTSLVELTEIIQGLKTN